MTLDRVDGAVRSSSGFARGLQAFAWAICATSKRASFEIVGVTLMMGGGMIAVMMVMLFVVALLLVTVGNWALERTGR